MLVWLASYPRSGNSLALTTLHYAFGAKVGADTGPERPAWLPVRLVRDLDVAREDPEPVFVKTHGRPIDDRPAIYLLRDGRDAIASYARWLKPRDEYADSPVGRIARMLVDGIDAGSRPRTWAESVELWTPRKRTAVVRFETLVADPVRALRCALDSLQIPYRQTAETVPSFEELRSSSPRVFRRGQTGNWRDELPPRLEERFWRSQGATMLAVGYTRDP